MIVSNNDHRTWLKQTFSVRGSAIPRTWKRVLFYFVFAMLITYLFKRFHWERYHLNALPFTLVGTVLGIYLGLRSNASYDRFWEGRKLWGGMVNITRTLTRQILTLLQPVKADSTEEAAELDAFQKDFVRRIIAYVHSFRFHLRDEDQQENLKPYLAKKDLKALEDEENVPIALLQDLGERLAFARKKGWVHDFHVTLIEESIGKMTDIQGACERIKSTPIPASYTIFTHRMVALYCFFLPFGVIKLMGNGTPLVVFFISYALLSLDYIGSEIEMPFDYAPNALALTTISRTIEANLRQRIGDEVPAPITPVHGVLQ